MSGLRSPAFASIDDALGDNAVDGIVGKPFPCVLCCSA
jgi:hypothetical protein